MEIISNYSRWYTWHRTWMYDPEWYNNPASEEGLDNIARYYKGAKSDYDVKHQFLQRQEYLLKKGGWL